MTKLICGLILALLWSGSSWAVIDVYQFEDEVQQKRFLKFSEELRCPKCQNQNLAGSNSPIAEDLRRELYHLISDGKSDKEIVDFMVARYGEYVLYRPQLQRNTYLLWGLPVAVFVVAMLVILAIVSRRNKSVNAVKTELTAEEQDRIQHLIKDKR